jgi:Alpha amylase, catalytic domain
VTEPALAATRTPPSQLEPRPSGVPSALAARRPWWRSAVIYEVYVRSFADGNGDGVGDLAGVRSRLTYLRDLGIDAIWFTPWYVSPMADGGYDVADYRRSILRSARWKRRSHSSPTRSTSASGRSSTSSRTTYRTDTRGSSPPSPLVLARPSESASGSAQGAGSVAMNRRHAGSPNSAAFPGRAPSMQMGNPAIGTCTSSRPSNPT